MIEEIVGKNESDVSVSFYIKRGIRIALAEVSIFPAQLAHDFIDDSQISTKDKKEIKNLINNSTKVMFFNRLNVPKEMRKEGVGTKLLQALNEYLNKENGFLINTANAYGDKDQQQLIEYYKKNQMVLIHSEGGFIYHKNIAGKNFELNDNHKKRSKIK